jgi:hypothetical protein
MLYLQFVFYLTEEIDCTVCVKILVRCHWGVLILIHEKLVNVIYARDFEIWLITLIKLLVKLWSLLFKRKTFGIRHSFFMFCIQNSTIWIDQLPWFWAVLFIVRIRVKGFFWGILCIDLMDLVTGDEINVSWNNSLGWVQSTPHFQFAKALKFFVFLFIFLIY